MIWKIWSSVRVTLPECPINQFKPVQQSRQQLLGAYCPNIKTALYNIRHASIAPFCTILWVSAAAALLWKLLLALFVVLVSFGLVGKFEVLQQQKNFFFFIVDNFIFQRPLSLNWKLDVMRNFSWEPLCLGLDKESVNTVNRFLRLEYLKRFWAGLVLVLGLNFESFFFDLLASVR